MQSDGEWLRVLANGGSAIGCGSHRDGVSVASAADRDDSCLVGALALIPPTSGEDGLRAGKVVSAYFR